MKAAAEIRAAFGFGVRIDRPHIYGAPKWIGLTFCTHTVPKWGVIEDGPGTRFYKLLCFKWLFGERGGTRTLDPMIKSHVLYHLSYALTCRAV